MYGVASFSKWSLRTVNEYVMVAYEEEKRP